MKAFGSSQTDSFSLLIRELEISCSVVGYVSRDVRKSKVHFASFFSPPLSPVLFSRRDRSFVDPVIRN